MAIYGAGSAVVLFPACFGVMVWGSAMCTEESIFAVFESHVTLFSTSEACRTISVV